MVSWIDTQESCISGASMVKGSLAGQNHLSPGIVTTDIALQKCPVNCKFQEISDSLWVL